MKKIGYHSTSEEKGIKILAQKKFLESNEKNWLGRGIYLWGSSDICNGFDEAQWWSKEYKKFSNYLVIEVEIDSNNFLDLIDNEEHKRKFGIIKRKFIEKHIEAGKNVQDFEEYLIFKVIDNKFGFDFIIAFIHGSDFRYRKIGFNLNVVTRPQIQICVKRQNCIVSIKRMEI